MFNVGDKIKRIHRGSTISGVRKGGVYVVAEVTTTCIKLVGKRDLFNPARFELVERYRPKKVKKGKGHFVYPNPVTNRVEVYDLVTKKLISEEEDVGLFFPLRYKFKKMKGYFGILQEEVTESFIKSWSSELEIHDFIARFNHEGGLYDLREYITVKPQIFFRPRFMVTKEISGIK
jgi:hypothetical protein